MKVGSLFSGIGGIDLGLERAGFTVAWQVENNPYCQQVLKRHWPEVPCYGDIYGIDFTTLASVDLLCGGFPCQPFSHAGRRTATADDRYLWPQFLRAIRELHPTFVLAENVYGLVTIEQGLVLETIYLDLEAEGYEVAPPVVFPAAAIGAPHRRDRVWICAHSRHDRGNSPQHWQQQARWAEELTGMDRAVTDITCIGLEGPRPSLKWIDTEADCNREGSGFVDDNRSHQPRVGGTIYGIPHYVERLRALGNAVVPQCAEVIGRVLLGTS